MRAERGGGEGSGGRRETVGRREEDRRREREATRKGRGGGKGRGVGKGTGSGEERGALLAALEARPRVASWVEGGGGPGGRKAKEGVGNWEGETYA